MLGWLRTLISIHALLAESDNSANTNLPSHRNFYPRSPCGERRIAREMVLQFSDFYPRSPCGERQPATRRHNKNNVISIHALLAESDSHLSMCNTSQRVFLSTLSLRRATSVTSIFMVISSNFYPRSPCGERQPATRRHNKNNVFLSTLSLRRATRPAFFDTAQHTYFYPRSPCGERRPLIFSVQPRKTISIHADKHAQQPTQQDFYPRSPCGERQGKGMHYFYPHCPISIHALLAESDTWQRGSRITYVISIHALLAESDPDQYRR